MADNCERSARSGWLAIWLLLVTVFAPVVASVTSHAEETESYDLTVAAFAAPGTPWDLDWQSFREHIETHAGGRINLKLLIRGEVGGESVMMTNIRRNRVQFGGFTLSGGAAVVPELSVLMAPYLFESAEELDFVMDEYMFDFLQPYFAAKGLVLIRWAETGWLNMYGKKPIIVPADARDYRLRSQASVASQTLVESLGGDLLQMPFQDLIPALQTGLVQGGETNVILYTLTGIAGEARYYTLTRHSYETGIVVASKAWFDCLPNELQTVVADAFPPSPDTRRVLRAMSRNLETGLVEKGVKLIEPTPEQRAKWIEATRNNHLKIIADTGGGAQAVYDRVIKAKRRYRDLNAAAKLVDGQ